MEGEGHFSAGAETAAAEPALSDLSEVILSALVDEHELGIGPNGPMFRLLKRHHPDLDDDGPAR